MSACHLPGNGPVTCVRDSDFESISDRIGALDEQVGGTYREASGAREFAAKAYQASTKTLQVVNELADEMRRDRKQQTLECDLRHAKSTSTIPPRMPIPSMSDYEEGEVTKSQDRGKLLHRAKVSEYVAVTLEEQNAALRARLEERDRHSDRVRNDAMEARKYQAKANEQIIKRWQIKAGIIVAIVALLTSAGQALVRLLGG